MKFLSVYRRMALVNIVVSVVVLALFFVNRELFSMAAFLYFVALLLKSVDEYVRVTPIR